jgi:UPF0716 family protein affecting phage T7 exclusion
MAGCGCLALIGVVAVIGGEVWGYIAVSHWLRANARDWVGSGWLEALLLLATTSVIGVFIIRHHVKRLPMALMQGFLGQGTAAGRHFVGLVGGFLLAVPGFGTDVLGLLLLLPPMPWLLAGVGSRLAKHFAAQAMKKMMGGGMPGMPGGFPFPGGAMPGAGMPGGFPFPGGMPRPDDRARKPGAGKVYDVDAEPDDRTPPRVR